MPEDTRPAAGDRERNQRVAQLVATFDRRGFLDLADQWARNLAAQTPARWTYGNPAAGSLGETDRFGNIIVRRNISHYEQLRTLAHEGVHQFLSPSQGRHTASTAGLLTRARAAAGMWMYNNSHFFRFTEELAAEWVGTRSVRQGFHLALSGYAIKASRLAAETVAIAVTMVGAFGLGVTLSDDE